MKPHARRVTLTAAVLGAGVIALFVVTQWERVCDHVVEWWTGNVLILPAPGRVGETVDIEPGDIEVVELLRFIANSTGRVIVVTAPQSESLPGTITVTARMNDVSAEMGLMILKAHRLDVMDSHWLRGAYALTTSHPMCVDEPTQGTLLLSSQ